MIQLVYRFKTFHSMISKTKFGVQDVISANSLNQFLISNTSYTAMSLED